MSTVLYYLGLAFLFAHELDAVTHSEWRLLPVLRGMPDATASPLFVSLHVPLFFAILWLSHHRREQVRERTRIAASSFLIVHAVLHFSLSSISNYEFHGALAKTLIAAAAAFGVAYLISRGRLR